MDKLQQKVRKYVEFCYTKIKLSLEQKTYQKNGISLKYLFERKSTSETLIVVFSACVRKGLKARYNYVRTLRPLSENKLFILDDFADDSRGCYYLGQYPEYVIEQSVKAMILDFCEKTNAKKLILCGSSKGGWASLNFGLDIPFPSITIICGGPQYFLGKYLQNFPITFRFLRGNSMVPDEQIIADLDSHLKNKIIANKSKPIKIFLHYSNAEHTYTEHIRDLLFDLQSNGFLVEKDQQSYKDHSDISLYFPGFLLQTIESELHQ